MRASHWLLKRGGILKAHHAKCFNHYQEREQIAALLTESVYTGPIPDNKQHCGQEAIGQAGRVSPKWIPSYRRDHCFIHSISKWYLWQRVSRHNRHLARHVQAGRKVIHYTHSGKELKHYAPRHFHMVPEGTHPQNSRLPDTHTDKHTAAAWLQGVIGLDFFQIRQTTA